MKLHLNFVTLGILLLLNFQMIAQSKNPKPLQVGVVGLTHTHVHWILGRPDFGDIEIVGIVETNRDLAKRYSEQHGFSMDIVFDTMEEMINAVHPEAVTAFGTIYDHLQVVETCAPLGIHVMVEKPMAISMGHAKKMKELAEKYKIHLLTNYETTWYATNQKTYKIVQEGTIGDIRKVVVHDGHKGPIELGINQEFLDWLTDPATNGAGALTDFGCYGVNLVTWLTNGQKPTSVMAVAQTIKPELYPKVDDEATIILTYPKMQAIIQASWNWPIARKDMEVYGKTGYVMSDNRSDLRYRLSEEEPEIKEKMEELNSPYNDPFAFFAAVVRNNITVPAYDLSSLENNMMVVEILDAAKESAQTGKVVLLDE